MDKLKMHTPNRADDNFKKLAALFPNAVTETINENGEVVRAIDKDVLMQEISCTVVEGKEERYQFTWPDKKKSMLLANAPISKTLRPCREESVDFDSTENLYIEGDNLEVLKLLQETYLGKVKMIYIDPPYNTGSDFVYEDDFAQSASEYLANSGQFDAEGNRLVQNTDTNGRFHSDWLNMIYPRLKLAKDLLTDDGVIFIAIDDNENINMAKVCSDVFGESNFVGCLIIQTATDNNPRQINTEHEYVLCYAKNSVLLESWQAESEKAQLIMDKYKELKATFGSNLSVIQDELRKWIKKNADALKGVTHYDNVDEKGVFHDGDIANTVFGGYNYEIMHPVTGKPCKVPDKGFRFAEKTMREMIAAGDIMFGADETTLIKPKKRLENAKDVLRSVIYEDGRASTKQFESLMARDIFQNPKSPMIIERLINFIVKPGDIVMDFFSGSATTAEAVMRLNAKYPDKKIRFIMVQLPEDLDESISKADSRAKKILQNAVKFLDSINKKHTICEIGKERLRRAGAKIKSDNGLTDDELDVGFRVLKCDTSNMKDVYYSPAEYEMDLFDFMTDNIKEDRTSEDLLFQVMLDLGVELSSKIEETVIAGKKVFNVADGFLIACFDADVTDETIKAIAQKQPYYFVMRDSSLANDSVATNFEQIFATYSPDTVRKVL
ncbi:site-specific DNA-methyltransferase [Fusibacillus kribbianus]|uniref:Site-specific DNA-methyltransferase n=1 Tax=Fusibacillus kribbianus TaxID=3044208 RepID=A0AAP4BCE2_9FIRM|nr:site-specific DNA-methyltransferase [Ruminococcus sp. YH-rum2234]MDI9243195.1 site-specific DNA-methyltransferase [Ruminococcus sp. YH-rum2234]